MNGRYLLTAIVVFYSWCIQAQNVGINNTNAAPANGAALDVDATNKGLLIPRLTNAQRDAIASPAEGLFIYNSTANKVQCWNGTHWIQLVNTTFVANNPTGTNTGRSVAISNTGAAAHPSAMLDVQSTTGGLLIPRMAEAQRNVIAYPPPYGLLIYNTDRKFLHFYSNTGWIEVCGAPVSSATGAVTTPQNVGINTSTPHPSAMLEVASTKAGLAIPRLSTVQRNAILSPAQGLMLFNTTTQTINVYTGSGGLWLNLDVAVAPVTPVAAAHTATASQIQWRWRGSDGALGYKWNTANDWSNAIDLGMDTTYTQTGLSCNTAKELYVWAYNCNGFSQALVLSQNTGACVSLTACGWNNSTTFTDTRDGKVYTQVQIGTQCWMAQNLNYGSYKPLPTVNGVFQSPGTKYCNNLAGNDDDSTCPYGALYQWDNLMNGELPCNGTGAGQPECNTPVQGLCPPGWHVPSHYEWTLLETTLGGGGPYDMSSVSYFGTDVGNKLKTAGNGAPPLWASPSVGTNSSGFSAAPAGIASPRFWNGGPYNTAFWTCTENTNPSLGCSTVSACAWYHYLHSQFANIARYISGKTAGYSVRCVKD